jgi:uncharacterized protein (TIGR02246 family)
LLLVGIVALFARCAANGETRVRDAIGEAWREHLAAVRRKDAAAVGRLYADDVVYIVPGEHEVRGREAIDAMEAQGLASVEIGDVTHRTEALRVHGDLALEIGTVAGPVRPRGQEAKEVTFRYVARWKRQADGRWRVQHMVGEAER